MLKRQYLVALLMLLFVAPLSAQPELLQSGPMVCYSEMSEVLLWAQTTAPARVKIAYWNTESPDKRFWTNEVMTEKNRAYTAHLVADQVDHGQRYEYELYINDEKVDRPYPLEFQTLKLWQWREDPPDFKFVIGSCFYVNDPPDDRPGEPYGGDFEIMEAIYEDKPDFMVWLGDGVYLREPDWNTRTGIFYRFTHTRSLPGLQPLLGSVHHYSIWDDHDYGPNNSDRSYVHREKTLETFKMFWGNPTYGVYGEKGTTTTFEWGDAQFFLLDNRYFKSPNYRRSGDCTVLGEHQVQWLIDALKSSLATWKFVVIGNQFLNPYASGENYINACPGERDDILNYLEMEDIPGVFWLTGDRHFTELSRLNRWQTYPLYDLTVSPLTSGANTGDDDEANYLRVDDTRVTERNYAILEISGDKEARILAITICDKDGNELWTKDIRADELR